jgi:hypothetical protein
VKARAAILGLAFLGCAPTELTPAGARVEVASAPRAGCALVAPVRASAGYNGRSAEANTAGAEAALRNDAAARGGDLLVIRSREAGAAPVDPRSASRGPISSGGCPDCVTLTGDAYRCPAASTPQPAASGQQPATDGFATAASAALSAAAEAARRCVPAGSAGGEAKVRVTFAASGDVVYAEVEGEPFAGTAAGACVAAKLRNAHVPPFAGEPRSVERALKITPPSP